VFAFRDEQDTPSAHGRESRSINWRTFSASALREVKTQIDGIEAGLARVRTRLPSLPADEILLSRLIVLIGREYSTHHDRLLRPRGLAEADFRLLAALFSRDDGTAFPSDLCESLAQSAANITRIADALVLRGLITRVSSEDDRRRMVLQITARGTELLHQCIPSAAGLAREVFACLSRQEVRTLAAQLKRVAAALDQSTALAVDSSTAPGAA
jgi:MarR family transcriptional regulator, negative regulator of the multidrug operon emrRAB